MLDLQPMENIPAHENPFWHDAISVGANLESIGLPECYVMASGKLGPGLYIVNTETGQRVKITGLDEH